MDNRQKIINAIQNRTNRLVELRQAERDLARAKDNASMADKEVARQIKNNCGVNKSVVFEDSIYTVSESCRSNELILTVVPSEYEILISGK